MKCLIQKTKRIKNLFFCPFCSFVLPLCNATPWMRCCLGLIKRFLWPNNISCCAQFGFDFCVEDPGTLIELCDSHPVQHKNILIEMQFDLKLSAIVLNLLSDECQIGLGDAIVWAQMVGSLTPALCHLCGSLVGIQCQLLPFL